MLHSWPGVHTRFEPKMCYLTAVGYIPYRAQRPLEEVRATQPAICLCACRGARVIVKAGRGWPGEMDPRGCIRLFSWQKRKSFERRLLSLSASIPKSLTVPQVVFEASQHPYKERRSCLISYSSFLWHFDIREREEIAECSRPRNKVSDPTALEPLSASRKEISTLPWDRPRSLGSDSWAGPRSAEGREAVRRCHQPRTVRTQGPAAADSRVTATGPTGRRTQAQPCLRVTLGLQAAGVDQPFSFRHHLSPKLEQTPCATYPSLRGGARSPRGPNRKCFALALSGVPRAGSPPEPPAHPRPCAPWRSPRPTWLLPLQPPPRRASMHAGPRGPSARDGNLT